MTEGLPTETHPQPMAADPPSPDEPPPDEPAPVEQTATAPAAPAASGAAEGASLPEPADLLLAQLDAGHGDDDRRFRRTLVVAALAHLALFLVVFPEIRREPDFVAKPGRVYVMQQTRFKKPPPRAETPQQEVPKKKAKKIPIPDPTPDEPEPLETLEVEIPEIEPSDVDQVVFGIPDGPDPGTGLTAGGVYEGDAMQIGDGVGRPVAIEKPQPPYTEEARQARIQGVVILTGIIDENGDVKQLKVVKGLPLGLDRTAIEKVATWKFKPATFEGKPVAVHMTFNVGFWLQ